MTYAKDLWAYMVKHNKQLGLLGFIIGVISLYPIFSSNNNNQTINHVDPIVIKNHEVLIKQLLNDEDAPIEFLRELANNYEKIGYLYAAKGDSSKAKYYYEATLAIRQKLNSNKNRQSPA